MPRTSQHSVFQNQQKARYVIRLALYTVVVSTEDVYGIATMQQLQENAFIARLEDCAVATFNLWALVAVVFLFLPVVLRGFMRGEI